MNNIETLIAVAGWEERFVSGVAQDIDQFCPRTVCVLTFEEFKVQTAANRLAVERITLNRGCAWREVFLLREPKATWTQLNQLCEIGGILSGDVTLDITTMPREVVWWILGMLLHRKLNVRFIYHKARSYSSEWLTRDTGEPRLLYQHSGIAKLGKPTCLLLLNGFDSDRSMQIINYFEPAFTLLGVQAGSQFDNLAKNVEPALRIAKRVRAVKTFDVDAYSPDQGYSQLVETVEHYRHEYNVIAASLGPKTSAISLFRLVLRFPEIALAYAPSREFNMEYSEGIGASIEGPVESESFP